MPVTNLLVEVNCSGLRKGDKPMHWTERFILNPHRTELYRLWDEAEKSGKEGARMVVGPDGLWWNDDMVFILDRACVNDHELITGDDGTKTMDWPEGLVAFGEMLETREYNTPGEVLTFERNNLKIKMTADCSDVSKGRMKWLEEEA